MRKTIDINFIKDQNYLMISEFNITVSDDEIDLLKHKIELTRWPDEINDKSVSYTHLTLPTTPYV